MPRILYISKCSMIITGIWRLPLTKNRIIGAAYLLYSIYIQTHIFVLLISFTIQFINMARRGKDLGITSEELLTTFAFVINGSIMQVKTFLCQTKSLREIISYVMLKEEEILQSGDEEIVRSHMKRIRFCKASNLFTIYFTVGVNSSIILLNAVQRFQIGKYNRIHNATLEKPFPSQMYYFGVDTHKYGTLLLAINDFSVIAAGFMFVSTQVIFIACIIFASSVLVSLQVKMRKMGAAGKDLISHLKYLVVEHQHVIAFVEKLNNSVKYLILLEFLLNSINLASVSVQVIAAPKNIFLVFPIFYFLLFGALTFVLGWISNEVKVQSLALSDALYDSPWYQQNENIKKILFIMIMRSQRPLTLTVGPFDAMTNQSALTIMKASYSYITLMSQTY